MSDELKLKYADQKTDVEKVLNEIDAKEKPQPENIEEKIDTISWSDFEKIDIRVGTIISVNDFPEAKNPAYQLEIDFGLLGIKKSSAQITTLYSKDDLINQQIIAVVNFPKKQIATFMSECLVMGVYGNNKDVILLNPERKVENGLKIG
ncbi:tRNA-binding protein [Faecalibacter macacae]|uniref:tRNA-binding protein n=1 Tax=Faecalibacter macacae TaxID=1859289 RepID=A0A3L9MJK3_9FLAO|nr:tRNA-binding protein [Faecalibacter macacae]